MDVNSKFERITGFPYNPNETVEIQKDKAYGLVYTILNTNSPDEFKWTYLMGSFNYLLGAYLALFLTFEDSDQHQPITVFYELEGNLTIDSKELNTNPTRVIHHARIKGDLVKECGVFFISNPNPNTTVVRRDLTNVQDFVQDFPPIDYAKNF